MSKLYSVPRESHSTREICFKLLTDFPKYRDVQSGETELIAHVQSVQRSYDITVRKASTISRTARILRAKHPELRGKDWKDNQTHAKRSVISQIKADTFARKNPTADLEEWQTTGESV